jgi:flagellar basal body-associated protein FliL
MGEIIGIIVIIVLIAISTAAAYNSWTSDSMVVRDRGVGCSKDRKDMLRYFFNRGTYQKHITDAQYDRLLESRLSLMNSMSHVLSKIGVDESEIQDIAPIHFGEYLYEGNTQKLGTDGKYRSTVYESSWLFFTSEQIHLYSYTFDLLEDSISDEYTEEYFYRDITSFSTSLASDNTIHFVISYPGGKFECSLAPDAKIERTIQGLKSLLREKKGQK